MQIEIVSEFPEIVARSAWKELYDMLDRLDVGQVCRYAAPNNRVRLYGDWDTNYCVQFVGMDYT
jgi:hypothetical protein